MSHRLIIVSLVAVLLLAAAGPAVAATDADTIADGVAVSGYHADTGTVSDAFLGDLVARVRNQGERMSFVVLSADPPGGAVTFADNVYDAGVDGVVVVVTPESVGWSGATEEFTLGEIDDALEASIETGGDDEELLTTFVGELTGEQPASSGSGGGGGWGFVWVLLIGAVLIGGFFWLRHKRRTAGPRMAPQLVEAKAAVQRQIDAVANDIIDMEDEVSSTNDSGADAHYAAAGEIYSHVSDAYASATTPETLLDLANRLDQAIWHLDSAEAMLDGRSPPPQPFPQQMPEPAPAVAKQPTSSAPQDVAAPPRPDYDRRPGRQSAYGGRGFSNLLMGALGAMMVTRSRSGRVGTAMSRRRPPAPVVRTRSSSRSSGSSGARPSGRATRRGRGRGGGNRR